MIVPTIATIVVGTAGLVGNISQANDADRARVLATLAADAGALMHELQNERAEAARLVGKVDADARAAYDKQTPLTDTSGRSYAGHRAALVTADASLTEQLVLIDQELADLPTFRKQIVKGGPEVSFAQAMDRYQVLITNLLYLRDAAAQVAGVRELSAEMRTAAAISNAKDFLSQERVVVIDALAHGSMTPKLTRDFIGKQTGQVQNLSIFDRLGTAAQHARYNQTVTGSEVRESIRYEGEIEALNGEDPRTRFTPQQWDAAMAGRANLIRKVEMEIDNKIIVDATRERNVLQRQVLIDTALLLGMLLLSILFAWIVARSMARSLRELRHGALAVAQYGLPQAVARLRDPALAAQMTPDQWAVQLAEPLPVRSRDEFGQVAEAFNAVHLEAVRTAAGQAALRASVAQMFVNLARRSQILVDRLIGHLDRLERGEEDPDQLAELFQLDHLATRMRRNDENLLILAGADSSRIQRDPAPLGDVLRAAQSEVEHYTRLEFGMIDRDVEIMAHAVNDMVHLIAELLENATAFSPPDAPVVVEARRVGDRAVLLVEDRGIGISPDQLAELNERLANPPIVDVAVSRMMGLVVVARLAVRHGVKVELRPARERGTIADVTLPPGVLVPRTLVGRSDSTGQREVLGKSNPPAGFGSPLALDKGSDAPYEQPVTVGTGGTAPLNQPAWSDLVSVNGSTPSLPSHPVAQPIASEVVPQHQFNDQWPTEDGGWSEDDPAITHPSPVDLPEPVYPSASSDDTVTNLPVTSAAPPAWPPVPEPANEHANEHAGYEPPTVPQAFAAALDMTEEIPRLRDEPAEPSGAGSTNGSAVDAGQRFVDATMELPIFREVESAWFRSGTPEPADTHDALRPAAEPASALAPVPESVSRPESRESVSRPESRESVSRPESRESVSRPESREYVRPVDERSGSVASQPVEPAAVPARAAAAADTWDTSADPGWRAAQALAEEREFITTETGLPKRVPMTQLVPGGVEKSTVSANRRTPEAVRGLLSAYHRGVQRGRTSRPDDEKTPEHTTAGPQNSQGGKEQQA